MSVADVAAAHYAQQKGIAAAAVRQAILLWQQVRPRTLRPSYDAIAERLFVVVAAAQLAAANTADSYVAAALVEQAAAAAADGAVRGLSFAGIASDGRSCESLLAEALIAAKTAVAAGAGINQALATGRRTLIRIVGTQVHDAGRVAVGVATVAHPTATGYARMLNPPSCDRCAVLAGRVYRTLDAFERHPLCNCRHIPVAENSGDHTTDPRRYFDSLTPAKQDRYFTAAGAAAIRAGVDIAQVVNVRGGMATAGGRAAHRTGRLMPEAIFAAAASRDDALSLLARHGYLT